MLDGCVKTVAGISDTRLVLVSGTILSMRWWAFWRRVQYLTGLLFIVSLISVGAYYAYWYKEPTCFDGIQNAEERAVDCGGLCERVCSFDIENPQTLWVEAFKIVDGQYNVVAYIENRNEKVGSPELGYTIRLYDEDGVIVERKGNTVLPPDGRYPIFEGRVITGTRVPTETVIEFNDDTVWLPAQTGTEQFSLEKRELENVDSKPRLLAQLRNTSLDEARNVEIIATIFDAEGKPLTASRTIVDRFSGRTTERVVFTWPEPIAKTLRSCEIPTDVVLAIDLSGSMNDDGGTPPEPITSVLSAAKSFVSGLSTKDQVGVVTYATEGSVVENLTHENVRVMDVIENLTIAPKEERGSTNTGEALIRMREELTSERHNENARKVGILLTDGLATAPKENPDAYAEEGALGVKSSGIQLFTIGLGAKVNSDFLSTLATKSSYYYNAPTIRELEGIYTAITKDICEDGPAVIEIISKTESIFSK